MNKVETGLIRNIAVKQINENQENQIKNTVDKIWFSLRRRKFIVLVPPILGLIALYFILKNLPPLYSTQTILAYDPQENQIVSKGLLMSHIAQRVSNVAAEVEIMQSLLVLQRVVKTLNLHHNEEFMSNSRKDIIKKLIKRWISANLPINMEINNNKSFELSEKVLINIAVDRLKKNLKVEYDQFTSLVTVNFSSTSPYLAARITNEIADAHLVHQLNTRFAATKRATSWLTVRLAEVRGELEAAEKRLEQYKAKHGLLNTTGNSIYQKQFERLNDRLQKAIAETALARIRFEQAQEIHKLGTSTLGTGTIENVSKSKLTLLNEIRRSLAKAKQKEAQLRTNFGSSHPSVRNIRAKIRDLKRQLSDEMANIVASLEAEYMSAKKNERHLQRLSKKLAGRAETANAASVKLRELEQNARTSRSLYESFLGRLKEASQYKRLESTDFRVVSRAATPEKPIKTKWLMWSLIVFAGTLGLGAGTAIFLDFFDPHLIRTPEEIETLLHVPVIAAIPKIDQRILKHYEARPTDIKLQNIENLSTYREAISQIRTETLLFNRRNPPKTILITSPTRDEGKTTLALSLARNTAQLGVRTLLMDCDLRAPSVLNKLNLEAQNGLVEVLTGKVEIKDAVIKDNVTNLHVLPTIAPMGQKATDLLFSPQTSDLMLDLQEIYDFIVIDTAPIQPVQDTRVLASIADSVAITLSCNETKRIDAQKTIAKLKAVDANIVGVIFNKSCINTTKKYYSNIYGYMVPEELSKPAINV